MERNDISINGKKLSQIEAELAEPFLREKMEYNQSGDSYFSVEVYEERLIEVLGGRRWFNIDCSPVQMYQVGGKYVVSVSVTVEILSDNNEAVWRKSAAGGSNVIIVYNTGEAKSLKSEVKIAMSEALKNVYQQFGIGIGQLRQMKKQTSNTRNQQSSRDRGPSNPGDAHVPAEAQNHTGKAEAGSRQGNTRERKILVKFLSPLNSMSGGYSADVVCVETGETRKLVIFKKSVPVIEKYCTMAKFIEHYKNGQTLTFLGYDNVYRGAKQFVFQEPDVKQKTAATS